MGVKFLRSLIRTIIQESYGVVFEIDDLADELAKSLLNRLLEYKKEKTNYGDIIKDKIEDFKFDISGNVKEKTLIEDINIRVQFKQNQNLTGLFTKNQTKGNISDNKHYYSITIDLKLDINFQKDIIVQLSSFLAHELHHAYDHIIRIHKDLKTKHYNSIKNIGNSNLKELLNSNPALKDFWDCFYLALPEEINTRVQEAYNEIKKNKGKSTQYITYRLKKTRAWRDAQRLVNYSTNEVLSLPKETKLEFFKRLSESKDMALQFFPDEVKKSINFYDEPKGFFKYWKRKFHHEGETLAFKLFKNTGALLEINEGVVMRHIGVKSLNELFGRDIFNTDIYGGCHGDRALNPDDFPD